MFRVNVLKHGCKIYVYSNSQVSNPYIWQQNDSYTKFAIHIRCPRIQQDFLIALCLSFCTPRITDQASLSNTTIGDFLKEGGPQFSSLYSWMFPDQPSSYGGTSGR